MGNNINGAWQRVPTKLRQERRKNETACDNQTDVVALSSSALLVLEAHGLNLLLPGASIKQLYLVEHQGGIDFGEITDRDKIILYYLEDGSDANAAIYELKRVK